MKRFTYIDNSKNGAVIFECNADYILEADMLFEEATGINPIKAFYIGCCFDTVKEEKTQ